MKVKWCTPYEFMKLALPDEPLLKEFRMLDRAIPWISAVEGADLEKCEMFGIDRSARTEAEKRPGVMIQADEPMDIGLSIYGSGKASIEGFTCAGCGGTDDLWKYLKHAGRCGCGTVNDLTRVQAPAISGVITERTCSVCSKACDVGLPCWWCGNE